MVSGSSFSILFVYNYLTVNSFYLLSCVVLSHLFKEEKLPRILIQTGGRF